jgi:hypothetical protein
LRTHSQSNKTHPQSYKERREFEESRVPFALIGFVTISSLAGVTPPSVANIEAVSNVTACRDEDEKKKVQAESA